MVIGCLAACFNVTKTIPKLEKDNQKATKSPKQNVATLPPKKCQNATTSSEKEQKNDQKNNQRMTQPMRILQPQTESRSGNYIFPLFFIVIFVFWSLLFSLVSFFQFSIVLATLPRFACGVGQNTQREKIYNKKHVREKFLVAIRRGNSRF